MDRSGDADRRHARTGRTFARVSKLFDEEEMVALTFAVVVINAWNRLAISFRVPPGSYQPAQKQTVAV